MFSNMVQDGNPETSFAFKIVIKKVNRRLSTRSPQKVPKSKSHVFSVTVTALLWEADEINWREINRTKILEI